MLFLLRPRQTWIPYAPLGGPPAPPVVHRAGPPARDPVADLKELAKLHDSGALTDDEFAAAKQRVLNSSDDVSPR
jgi:hypothetical protein